MTKTLTTTPKTVKKERRGIHSANYQIQIKTSFEDFIQDFQKIYENLKQLNYVRQKYYRNSSVKQQNFMQAIFQEIKKDPSLLPSNLSLADLQQLEGEMQNLLEGKRYLDQISRQWQNKMHQIANAQGTLASQTYTVIKGRALAGDAEMTILAQKLALYHQRQRNGKQQAILKGNFADNGDFVIATKAKTSKKHRVPKESLFTIPHKDMKL